jgi:signal transduction histidine kinase
LDPKYPFEDPSAPGDLIGRLLRVPLRVKLAGANLLLILAAGAILVVAWDGAVSRSQLFLTILLALSGSLLLNLALVHLALAPLEKIESVAARVWKGNLDARVAPSPLADRDMLRVGNTLNVLLDRLAEERSRIRELATQVIRAGDEERSRLARELHDSTAQTLAALALQASSALQSARDPGLREQLELIRVHAVDALEEVRTLSHTVHPRVLDDLGLLPALETLARRTREAHEVEVTVTAAGDASALASPLSSVLYTIAQEAVTNAVRHGAPRSIQIMVVATGDAARLEIADDGHGFDAEAPGTPPAARGLFVMAERAALVDGKLQIDSTPGRGTRIVATVPTTLATHSPAHE